MKKLFTSESVTEGHPDKMCDQISDAILDAIMEKDPYGRVACETTATTGYAMVMGEISTNCYIDIPKIVRSVIKDIGYDRAKYGFDGSTCAVLTAIDEQSGDIAMGVDKALEYKEGTLDEHRYEHGQKDSAASGYTTDWYLKGITNLNLPTTSVEAIAASGALAYHTWRDHDQLLQRLGDLRQHGREEEGVWVRVKGGKLSRSDQFEFENKYTQYELGYDQKLKSTPAYTRYAGISFSYFDGDSSYSSGSGENKVKALNIYGTQIGAKGHYLDLVLKYSQLDNDFKVFDTSGNKITGDYDQNGLSISAEYGRKNNLKNNWYIEPQAQLTFGRLRGTDYTTSNGIRVDQDGIDSFVGRIGFNICKDINEKTNIYLKANLMHEFGGGYNASMVDAGGTKARLDRDFDDTWFEYGLGAAVQTGKNNYFYVDVERSAGSDYKKDWQWNVGARWSF